MDIPGEHARGEVDTAAHTKERGTDPAAQQRPGGQVFQRGAKKNRGV